MKTAHIFAFFVISLALGFAVFAFMGAVPQYLTIKQARNSTTPVQVKGNILHSTVRYDKTAGALRFEIEDDNKERIQIVYRGAKPDAFDTAPETAATGLVKKAEDGTEYFDTKSIIVKCPSKYDDKGNLKKSASPTPVNYGLNKNFNENITIQALNRPSVTFSQRWEKANTLALFPFSCVRNEWVTLGYEGLSNLRLDWGPDTA